MFEIELTPEAIEDIHQFRKYDRQKIIEGIETQLTDINKESQLVKIEAVGYKTGSRLFIHGEEYQL